MDRLVFYLMYVTYVLSIGVYWAEKKYTRQINTPNGIVDSRVCCYADGISGAMRGGLIAFVFIGLFL